MRPLALCVLAALPTHPAELRASRARVLEHSRVPALRLLTTVRERAAREVMRRDARAFLDLHTSTALHLLKAAPGAFLRVCMVQLAAQGHSCTFQRVWALASCFPPLTLKQYRRQCKLLNAALSRSNTTSFWPDILLQRCGTGASRRLKYNRTA